MSGRRTICVVTGSRAEYGLLYWVLRGIESAEDLELQLVVTGMHLSARHGHTVDEIEKEFSEWLEGHIDELPVPKHAIQDMLKERTW